MIVYVCIFVFLFFVAFVVPLKIKWNDKIRKMIISSHEQDKNFKTFVKGVIVCSQLTY